MAQLNVSLLCFWVSFIPMRIKKQTHTSYAQTDFEHAILNHSFMYSLGFMHCGIHFYELLFTPRFPPLIPRSRQQLHVVRWNCVAFRPAVPRIAFVTLIEFGHWRSRPIYEQNSPFSPLQKMMMVIMILMIRNYNYNYNLI